MTTSCVRYAAFPTAPWALPNYHGYNLDDLDFARLLRRATEYHLIVQLALLLEHERAMHPLLRVPPVDPAPLAEVVQKTPGLRLVLLNALRSLRGQPLRNVLSAGQVYVEIAMLERIGGVAGLLEEIPQKALLFGSHASFYYFESAFLKLQESPLSQAQLNAIRCENAQRLLTGSKSRSKALF